jgi:Bacterial SH3 domain
MMKIGSMLLAGYVLSCSAAFANAVSEDYRVDNTRPPDAFLALRTKPSSVTGHRIMTMPNGTPLKVFQRNGNGWWYVRVLPNGPEGWALSGQTNKTWIVSDGGC